MSARGCQTAQLQEYRNSVWKFEVWAQANQKPWWHHDDITGVTDHTAPLVVADNSGTVWNQQSVWNLFWNVGIIIIDTIIVAMELNKSYLIQRFCISIIKSLLWEIFFPLKFNSPGVTLSVKGKYYHQWI